MFQKKLYYYSTKEHGSIFPKWKTICKPSIAVNYLLALTLGLTIFIFNKMSAQAPEFTTPVLVWADEFDGTTVDETNWTLLTGDGTDFGLPPGWGNNELQYYLPENATVDGGFLTITAKEEPIAGYNYTSSRMITANKQDFTYGRFEMRAKMPIGQGIWPAFWMFFTGPGEYGGWAASGEIDIMEYLGNAPNEVFGTIHFGQPFPNNLNVSIDTILTSGNFNEEFHIFSIEWEPGEIRWYLDNDLYATQTIWWSNGGPYPAPFDQDFHLLLNLAVGGNLPGNPDATTVFPQEYIIDYVRVYQNADLPTVSLAASNTTLNPADNLTLTATPTAPLGVSKVEYFQREYKLGETTSAPYELIVSNVAEGAYKLRAVVTDATGKINYSEFVDVTVGSSPQGPYAMNPIAIPGVVEMELFDVGGQGVAYNDATPDVNSGSRFSGNIFRNDEGVDLEPTSDVGGGSNVGFTEVGEWLEFTVDVQESGLYDVEVRVASQSNSGSLRLEVDGVDKTGSITFPATGGFQDWVSVRKEDVALDAGVQVMRMVIEDAGFNINKIVITPADPSAGDKVVFDDMEHGDPFGNGWFAFNGSVGGGGIDPNFADLPPANGGNASLQTGWGSGGTPGFLGGFGRTNPVELSQSTFFNFWINPDAGQDYTLEINLQEDDDGDNVIADPNNGADDEFQFNCTISETGPCAVSGGGWQLVSIPLSDFVDDNSFLTGGNGILDAVPVSGGGNGQLINVIISVVSNSGADVTFRTDYWSFTNGPLGAEIAVAPASNDFGTVPSGNSAFQAFTVTNEGCSDLEVTATSILGPDVADFMIFNGGAPFTVAPGSSKDIIVTFTPTSEGPKSTTLRIESNDTDENPLDVALTGEGTAPTGNKLVFDDMEHGDPANNDWFTFSGLASGGIDANNADLPPENGGSFSLQTGWGSGGTPGFFGGFGRTNSQNLFSKTYFNFWINPDAGQDYVMEINLQEDDNGDNSIDNPNDDEFQYNLTVGPEGSGAEVISGGGWQLVSIPFSDFFDDNSIFNGGNGVFDPTPTTAGGNGQLINVVIALISNTGADISFRTDYWVFTEGPLGPGIAITPEEHDYGLVNPGATASQTFTVTNEGCADLVVPEISLIGPNASEFNINNGGGVFTLAPGATREIEVSFNPTGSGARFATLRIESNDTNNSPKDIPLTANQDLLEGKVVFDNMEHGNPFGNGWFAFNGAVGGGGIDANASDLPPANGGAFSLQTGWGSGGTPGFMGGFGRTFPTDLSNMNYFNFWINPDAGQEYTLEINLQEDDNSDNGIGNPNDDEFQYNLTVGPEGSEAEVISGGGWQLVSIPFADFFDDNNFLNGGNGELDPIPSSAGGNGQLINVVFAVISNSGADVTFRTDFWCFSEEPLQAKIVFDDMEHGDPLGNGWFAFNGNGGGGVDPNDTDLPPQDGGFFSLQTGWGSGGNPGFFGGFGRINPVQIADVTHFNLWINPDPGQDFILEINLQEDDDGDGAFPFPAPNDDEFQFNLEIGPNGKHGISGGGWQLISIPLDAFFDDNSIHGGNGIFDPVPVGSGGNGQLIGIVIAVISNSGADVTFRTDFWCFSDGPLEETDILVEPLALDFGEIEVGNNASKTITITNEGISNLWITSTNLTGDDAAQFLVNGNTEFAIPGGKSQPLELSFNPVTASPVLRTANLSLQSNDPDETPTVVQLSGAGIPGLAHPYILLAEKKIELEKGNGFSGDMHSNGDIDIKKGNPSTYTADLTAVKKIKIEKDNTIEGNVQAGDKIDLDKDAVVTGIVSEFTQTDKVPLPRFSFTASGENVNLGDNEILRLEPGSYGEVKMGKNDTLLLQSGEYFFKKLEINKESNISANITNGPVIINVVEEVKIDKEVSIDVSPIIAQGSRYLTINSLGDVDIDKNTSITGSIIAPGNRVKLDKEFTLNGIICANEIVIKKDANLAFPPFPDTLATPMSATAQTYSQQTTHSKVSTKLVDLSIGSDVSESLNFRLYQNYPNPFTEHTTIRFQLPESGKVTLVVFDMRGVEIATLYKGVLTGGVHEFKFESTGLPGGLYLYKVQTDKFTESKMMIRSRN